MHEIAQHYIERCTVSFDCRCALLAGPGRTPSAALCIPEVPHLVGKRLALCFTPFPEAAHVASKYLCVDI